jgi:hypothetical protein
MKNLLNKIDVLYDNKFDFNAFDTFDINYQYD